MNTIKFNLAFFLVIISYPVLSQEVTEDSEMRTLFHKNQGLGGYGAVTARYSDIGTAPGAIVGFRGCMIAGHNIAFGIAGNGLVSNFKYDPTIGKDALWAGGYGGFLIEPIIGAKSAIHLALPVMVGAGGISYTFDSYQNNWDSDNTDNRNYVDSKAFFIIEPGVEIEMNLLKFFRLSLGGYYRYTSNVTLHYDDNTPINKAGFLNGFSGGITLKFGKF